MNRSEAQHDLGGNIPSSVDLASEIAMYNAGLGSPEMRRRIEKHLRSEEDARQRRTNAVGAALVREAGIKPGTDRDSVEFRLKQIREQRERTRRS